MLNENKTQKRIARHSETQEDFTPIGVVNAMLDLLPKDAFTDMSKTIIDFSAGNGNFLVEILDRKLDNSKDINDAINALKSIYGVELMADNVEECRERLYALTISRHPKIKQQPKINNEVRKIIKNRIQWCNALLFDYEHWPEIPKSEGEVSFKEIRTELDSKYPMWYKEKEPLQLSFDF